MYYCISSEFWGFCEGIVLPPNFGRETEKLVTASLAREGNETREFHAIATDAK